jgi:hypothetical protein
VLVRQLAASVTERELLAAIVTNHPNLLLSSGDEGRTPSVSTATEPCVVIVQDDGTTNHEQGLLPMRFSFFTSYYSAPHSFFTVRPVFTNLAPTTATSGKHYCSPTRPIDPG